MKDYLKKNKLLSNIVFYGLRILMWITSIFIKRNSKKILFTSYTGRQYSDSPKTIYEELIKDSRFSDYELIWAFEDPQKFPEIKSSVNINSFKFFKILLVAKFWIANTSIERLSAFKPKGTIYIQTWHGVPLKFLGQDEKSGDNLVKKWYSKVNFDLLCSTGTYNTKVLKRIFPNSKQSIAEIGLPRNNELLNYSKNEIDEIKKELGITGEKKIILYAPTFREYKIDKKVAFPFTDEQLSELSKNYIILNRGHYFVNSSHEQIANVIDVTDFPDVNKLLKISEGLITDYSSIMFDYALLNRPILLLVEDLKEYQEKRGIYVNIEELGFDYFNSKDDLFNYLNGRKLSDKVVHKGLGEQIVNNNNISVIMEMILKNNKL